MKVKELIRQLEECDPDARVYLDSWEGKGYREVLLTLVYSHDTKTVILEDATQFDVAEEIEEMLRYFEEEGVDETDGYQIMVDRGYTPEVVAEHLGFEMGIHMKAYCFEHGIC